MVDTPESINTIGEPRSQTTRYFNSFIIYIDEGPETRVFHELCSGAWILDINDTRTMKIMNYNGFIETR